MKPLISLSGVRVDYDGYNALEDVSFEIFEDDFIGIIGPNGGGKTTLIKAILGAVKYSGRITFSDKLYRDRHRLIGYMPQQSVFDRTFPISIEEVVLSGLQANKGILTRYAKADRRKASELMAGTGIASIAGRSIGEVSGGQMQRALLCRAIIADPKLLILDEPANFVDNKFENELYASLKRLNERMAIVMVSHDIGTITSIVKDIVCVNRSVHRHDSNRITHEQLLNYNCPIQIVSHGDIPHTILEHHSGDCCCDHE